MNTSVQEKLDKLYKMYVGRGASAGERTNAHRAMTKIARKNKVNLEEFIQSKDFDREFEERARAKEKAAAEARQKAEEKAARPPKRLSRRAFIIRALYDNIWDADSLAEVLHDLGYGDKKVCAKAVSGTMYDLSTNKGYFYRKCTDGRVCCERPARR